MAMQAVQPRHPHLKLPIHPPTEVETVAPTDPPSAPRGEAPASDLDAKHEPPSPSVSTEVHTVFAKIVSSSTRTDS